MKISDDPNQNYIIAAYAITALVMGAVALYYILRSRKAQRKIIELEKATDET